MEEIISSYMEACKENQVQPKNFFLSLIEKSYEETEGPPLNIDLCGSQTPLFNDRINNKDILSLLNFVMNSNLLITHLNLSCNELDDGSVPCMEEFMKKNGSLRYLNITGNNFTPEGVARLTESIISNFYLESLVLDENDVGQIGGLRIGVLLEKNISIRHISLHNTNLTIRSILSILQNVKNHASLLMFSMSHISGRYHDIPDLSEFYFRLQNCLYQNSNLKRLYLPYCKLRDEGLGYLVRGLSLNKHSNLEVLDVKGNEICVEGAKTLCLYLTTSKYSKIRILDLSFNRIQTIGVGYFVDGFKKGKLALEELNLCSNSIGDIGLYNLANVIKDLSTTLKLNKVFILKNNLFEQRSKKAFFELYEKKKNEIEMDMKPYCNLNNENEETYFLAEVEEPDDFFEEYDPLVAIDEYKQEITDMIEKERKK